ncbi:helix-turn-helix domain-containing protein [Streptomyces cyaneofuscatus]|uniref:helix-turn-helix domain-containing protein n=1 Tax=Streptomyces cyaneofuscatus TaxID=66883 RepID=UPI00369D6E1C
MLPRLPVGERVRDRRRRLGRTQAVLAGLCGITTDYLSQIERGLKTPSGDVLARLAAELQVPVGTLLGDTEPEHAPATPSGSSRVVQALLQRHGARNLTSAGELRARVEHAWKVWQTSPRRFTEAEALLPDLIPDVEGTIRALRAGNDATARRETLRIAADLYGLLRSYYRRTGRSDLSLMVADRALRAAEDADDPLRVGAARWNLGHVLLAQPGSEQDAADIAMDASHDLTALDTPAGAALRGALELVAVVAEARSRRPWAARERLAAAVPLARQTGESNVHWTVFGPTNVMLHAVNVEMTDGDATEGLRLADRIDATQLPSRERQFTFGLEVARCYDLRRDDAAVLVHLLELEQLAPEDLQHSPLGRELVISLLGRVRPTYRPQATGLAQRLQLL